ncbi:MAG: helix-turn-helix domain-containing protein, partial [Candidatus Methanomethylophilus sp.]|nr:helix-turn-helix domain-containing protein [Methanomethylophilus sp.]
MTEIRTMELRLYPNKTQERTMLDTIGHCCFLYNHLLEHCRDAFAEGLRHPTEYDMNKEVVAFKKEHPELTAVYSQVLTNVSTRVS